MAEYNDKWEKAIPYTVPKALKMYQYSEGDKAVYIGNDKPGVKNHDVVTISGASILDGEVIYRVMNFYEDYDHVSECYLRPVAPKEVMEAIPDMVNPDHYKTGGIETFDILKAKLTTEELIGFCKGNVLKYTLRANFKGDSHTDLKKAKWYMDKLNELMD